MHKAPWELPYVPQNTKKAFDNKIRGDFRQGVWKKFSVKLYFLSQRKTKRMVNKVTGRQCKHDQCDICREWFANPDGKIKGTKKNVMEVDHITPTRGYESIDDAGRFAYDLCYISVDDLQRLCWQCHQVKTLADKRGISFEDAKIEKEVIRVMNFKSAPLKKWLAKRNMPYLTPAKKNVDVVRDIVIEENTSYGKK